MFLASPERTVLLTYSMSAFPFSGKLLLRQEDRSNSKEGETCPGKTYWEDGLDTASELSCLHYAQSIEQSEVFG